MAVAFAKVGPLLRLSPSIEAWKNAGKTLEAIFGIDHEGTSIQALEFAIKNFDIAYVTHAPPRVTFHPKLYLFSGTDAAVCYVGSHNLTVGGTETNFEAGVKIEMDLPADAALFADALSTWTSLLPPASGATTQVLDAGLLADLVREQKLFDEDQPASGSTGNVRTPGSSPKQTASRFPFYAPKPPSAIPPQVLRPRAPASNTQPQPTTAAAPTPVPATALVIQIVPHHNGEIFLSKIALDQNPAFFGYPFTGATTPKQAHNPSYPQRIPDPVVAITVYGADSSVIWHDEQFNLNTVLYTTKSEVRITIPQQYAPLIEPYSVMVMELARPDDGRDYNINIYAPGTPRYSEYLAVCNQTLPSGGAAQPRKMGWI